MQPHYREDEYLDKIIKKRFSSSLMSNRKWVKIITALINNSDSVKKCFVKPIWDDEEPTRELLIDQNKQFDIDFYSSAMESMISGKPIGWYAYKEIEWLDFPKNVIVNQQPSEQDLGLIEAILLSTGELHIYKTVDNLRLYAYI